MCQVHGPTPQVACTKCGAGYYENAEHTCKLFVPFEQWNNKLQTRAAEYRKAAVPSNWLQRAGRNATINVAEWPEYMRRAAWQEEMQFSVKL